MNEEIIFKWDREWDRESVGKHIYENLLESIYMKKWVVKK